MCLPAHCACRKQGCRQGWKLRVQSPTWPCPDLVHTRRLYLNSDAGSALYVNDELVVDNDFKHKERELFVSMFLSKGMHKSERRGGWGAATCGQGQHGAALSAPLPLGRHKSARLGNPRHSRIQPFPSSFNAVRIEYFNDDDDDTVLQFRWKSDEKGIKEKTVVSGALLKTSNPNPTPVVSCEWSGGGLCSRHSKTDRIGAAYANKRSAGQMPH